MTTDEVAVSLGIKTWSVSRAIRRGTLAAVRVSGRGQAGQRWEVDKDEVERYRREHLGQRGRRKE